MIKIINIPSYSNIGAGSIARYEAVIKIAAVRCVIVFFFLPIKLLDFHQNIFTISPSY